MTDPKVWAAWHLLKKAKENMDEWEFAKGYRRLSEALDHMEEAGYKPEEEKAE